MSTNLSKSAPETLSLPVPGGTVSGDPVLVGELPGVAITNESGGQPPNPTGFATVKLSGQYRLAVDASSGAVAVGDRVYYDGTPILVTDPTGNTAWGLAIEALGAGTVTIEVLLGRFGA